MFKTNIEGVFRRDSGRGQEAINIKINPPLPDGSDLVGLGFVKKGTELKFDRGSCVEFEYSTNPKNPKYKNVEGGVDGVVIVENEPAPAAKPAYVPSNRRSFGEAGGYPIDEAGYERSLCHRQALESALKILDYLVLHPISDRPYRMVKLVKHIELAFYFRLTGDEDEGREAMERCTEYAMGELKDITIEEWSDLLDNNMTKEKEIEVVVSDDVVPADAPRKRKPKID